VSIEEKSIDKKSIDKKSIEEKSIEEKEGRRNPGDACVMTARGILGPPLDRVLLARRDVRL